jgi:hypothetical protein
MELQLIPFPISIIFVIVFAVVWMIVLRKLSKTAKIYSILFRVSALVLIILFVLIFYEVAIGAL